MYGQGTRDFAWALLVPNEGFVERALLAGNLLHAVATRWKVLCLVSSSISPESLDQLNEICDQLVVKTWANPMTGVAGENSLDEFLLASMGAALLPVFRRVAVLHPDVVILRQFDAIFEQNNNGMLVDTRGKWSLVLMDPKNLLASRNQSLRKSLHDGQLEDGTTQIVVPRLSELSSLVSLEKKLSFVKLDRGEESSSNADAENVLKRGGIWNEVVAQKMYSAFGSAAPTSRNQREYLQEGAIAVIGMSSRFPGANSPEEYWNILESGRVTASSPPLERAGLCQLNPRLAANFLACRVDHFDAEFFGVAPSEAEFIDPQSRLVLEASWEALEDAGIVPGSLRGSSTGVFCGSWLQDYKELMNGVSPATSDPLRKYMGNGFGCGAAKLSFFYGLAGPNIATESACSSSIMAVDLAVKSLARGECNLALATGANLILQWKENKNVVWAADGISKTFDALADGYGRAEGVGVLVLRRYSDAVANNDRIYGLIVGSGVSQEGESVSFGAPTVKSEARAMKAALRAAGVFPSDVDFIEAHATGTAVGDPIEAAAIVEAYNNNSGERRRSPLYIASGKTNIGHTESCSGIAGIIKVLLSLEHETIPRHVNLGQPNPKVNFEQLGGVIPLQNVAWPRSPERERVAAVSSFGITGTDVHVILREAPPGPHSPQSTLCCLKMSVPHPLCLSARNPTALEQLTQSYSTFLEERGNKAGLMDIVYTANGCRAMHCQRRRVIIGRTTEELRHNLRNRKWIDGSSKNYIDRIPTAAAAAVCFTFPGFIGKMELASAAELYSSFPVFRMNLDRCDDAFRAATTTTQSKLLQVLFAAAAADDVVSPAELLPRPIEWYACVIAVQYSMAQLWISWGVRPAFVLGHCLGEIPAAMVSGVVSVEDGLKLVSLFNRFLELAKNGRIHAGEMLAVRADHRAVEQLITDYLERCGGPLGGGGGGWLDVAALNSQTQTVVAGETGTLQGFKAFCEEVGMGATPVAVDLPFHSRGMQPAVEAGWEDMPESFRSKTTIIPYISSVTGGLVQSTDMNKEYWASCFQHQVHFTSACHSASTLGIELFLEIGLSSSLSKLTAENVAEAGGIEGDCGIGRRRLPTCIPSLGRAGGGGIVECLANLVALGIQIDWEGYYQFYRVRKVSLPHYPFQRKPYWFNVGESSTTGEDRVLPAIKAIHPLLGARLSMAKGRSVTFEGRLHNPGAEFINDHVIGNEVVFPAAAFLEMMLAGGMIHDGYENSKAANQIISIQDFHISAPLLVASKSANGGGWGGKTQTVMEGGAATESSKTAMISVFSERGSHDWILHASGVAHSSTWKPQTCPPANHPFQVPVELAQIKARCSERKVESNNGAQAFYQQMASAGLNFGAKFRSILDFARNEKEMLAEVECPSVDYLDTTEENILLHPILIDSMIQAFFIHKGYDRSGRLHVPVSVGRLVVIPSRIPRRSRSSPAQDPGPHLFHVYCRQSENEESCESQALLLDSHGVVLALMEAPVLATTSVEALLEAGIRGENEPLRTFEVTWEPAQHQLPPPSPLSSTTTPPLRGAQEEGPTLSPGISTMLAALHQTGRTVEDGRLDEAVSRLCSLYVLNMLYEVGWEPEVGVAFPLSDLIHQLKVKESLGLAFSRYLDFLVEDGLLERESGGRMGVTLKDPLPPWSSVRKGILNHLDLIRDYPVTRVISACGSKLGSVLRGELSGQYILFGMVEDGRGDDGGGGAGESLAETYYSNSRFTVMGAALTDLFEQLVEEQELGQVVGSCGDGAAAVEPLRILEVGAGTGAFTRTVIPFLARRGLPFRYYFTDISASYLEKAKERFRAHETSLECRLLDIERDPLEQGFPPHYFHLAVGVDVFHATSHLQRTIDNVRLLTRVGGTLLIGETEGPDREIDIIFGILSGYWLFQDKELRTNHCLVGADTWERVLKQAGFSGVAHMLTAGGRRSVILGRASSSIEFPARLQELPLTPPAPRRHWLLFGDLPPQEFLEGLAAKMRAVGRELTVETDADLSLIRSEYLSDLHTRSRTSSSAAAAEHKTLEGVLCFAGRVGDGGEDGEDGEEMGEWWRDRREVLRAFFLISKWIGQRRVSPAPRLHLVTTGTWLSGHEGDFGGGPVVNPSSATLWGLARNARIEVPDLNSSKSIDLDPGVELGERLVEALLTELWLDDKEPEVVHRQGCRYVRRLRAEQRKQNVEVDFPRGSRFEVALPKSKVMSELSLVPKREAEELTGEQIEVQVRAASLNFRDVLTVMKPANSVFESMSMVGIDYSGIVTRVGPEAKRLTVGDSVYGLSMSDSTIASHIITEESHGSRMPPGLTFSEGATLPAVFLTVWYSMLHVARVEAGQVVLVHAVTGGVGLLAIQIARLLGVELIGTAGSARKRNFARSLGLRHVFNSRDLTFAENVGQVTGGTGVDMVLNCLTGPGFKEASIDLVKDGGHFVELSKLDIWSEGEAASVRPHVHYKVLWVPDIAPRLIREMMSKMNELVESGDLSPLPRTRFQASHLTSAFGYLQRAKQLGKVIVELPTWQVEERRFRGQLFEGSSRSYLITGGMGAIGLAVTKWMVGQGARHVVLVGRSQPNPAALETISQLNKEFGANVVCKQVDISSYEECRMLLESLRELLPPLGGIHHAAGILSDKLLVNQSWAEFQSVLNSKVDGLYNLHRLSTHLPSLQFFVAHSSLSSTFGNAGQSNYVAGNTYMDSLMDARSALGLPGLVVNWGQWKAGGLAENVETEFTIPFSVQDGIAALERLFQENKTSVAAGRIKFPALLKMYPLYVHTFLQYVASSSEWAGEEAGATRTRAQVQLPFLTRYNSQRAGLTVQEREAMILDFVRELLSSILGLGSEDIEDDTLFSSMGMDSLMSIDFTNKLQSELPGANVGYIDMEEFGSAKKLTAFISSLIS